jgi:hypothetical protein
MSGVIYFPHISEGWSDLPCRITQAGGVSSLTFERYRDTNYFTYFFRYNQSDTLHLEWQMPHAWDKVQVRPHIHVEPQADPLLAQRIRFVGEYSWSQLNEATPPLSGWTSFDVSRVINPGDVFKQTVVGLALIIPPVDIATSAILYLRVQNLPYVDGPEGNYSTNKDYGTVSANLMVSSIDAHIRQVGLGTKTEFA